MFMHSYYCSKTVCILFLQAEQQRVENYENFLKEQKVQKRQASWCDFPETKTDSKKPKFQHDKKKVSEHTVGNQHSENHFQRASGTATTSCEETDKTSSVNNDKTTKKKKSKKNKEKTSSLQDAAPAEKVNESNNDETKPQDAIDDQDMSKKKAKKNKKKKNSDTANSTESSKTDDNKLEKPGDQPNKGQNQTKVPKKKKKKLVDGKPVRRKAENDSSFQLIINGKEVELVRFEGFPIMRKDADRLQDLKNNMIRRGIPKSEVQRTIKLERRRAEKALARLKRDVCYNCRKGGHNLSDCPELKSKIPGENGADGVCFKCGSTEHRQFECKVQKDKEFRFASCFICREQVTISIIIYTHYLFITMISLQILFTYCIFLFIVCCICCLELLLILENSFFNRDTLLGNAQTIQKDSTPMEVGASYVVMSHISGRIAQR